MPEITFGYCIGCGEFDCTCAPTYTRDDARDDHAINQWEIANDLRDDT